MKEENIWEERYNDMKDSWGIEAEYTLIQYEELVPEGKILDIGVGEGRNILKFALKGYEIEGIDISRTAIDRCERLLNETECRYTLSCYNLLDYEIKADTYSLILSTWVLNFIKKSESFNLLNRMKEGLIKGGVIYLGVFSKEDPMFHTYKNSYSEVEEGTFYLEDRDLYYTYYDLNELMDLFGDKFELVCRKEDYSLDYGHGDRHYHGAIELMMRKT
ncbi:MAG: class I SAM-dependent methyltransferase [Halanaerobiales bacterium]